MEVTEIDYEIFSLPKKEIKILDKYMFSDKQLRLKIRWKVINHKCPKCGWHNTKRYWKTYETVLVNHTPRVLPPFGQGACFWVIIWLYNWKLRKEDFFAKIVKKINEEKINFEMR